MDRPFGFWVGEREQLIHADRVVEYPRHARRVKSSINICPEQSMIGVLLTVSENIGGWIMALDCVSAHSLRMVNYNNDEGQPVENFRSGDYRHPILRDVDLLVDNFVRLGLNEWQYRYLLATDGAQIRYRVFLPQKKAMVNLGIQALRIHLHLIFLVT
jgi:hypothetical protein